MKAQVIIERGADGTFDANMEYIKDIPFGLLGQGKTVAETIADFYNSYEEMRAMYQAESKTCPALDFEFKYDIPSFLQYYAYAFTLAGLERITGVNQKQLGHYISGFRKPSRMDGTENRGKNQNVRKRNRIRSVCLIITNYLPNGMAPSFRGGFLLHQNPLEFPDDPPHGRLAHLVLIAEMGHDVSSFQSISPEPHEILVQFQMFHILDGYPRPGQPYQQVAVVFQRFIYYHASPSFSSTATRFAVVVISSTDTTGRGRAATPFATALASISSPSITLLDCCTEIGTPPPI